MNTLETQGGDCLICSRCMCVYIYFQDIYIYSRYAYTHTHTQTFTYAFRHSEFSGILIVFLNMSTTEPIELDIYRYLLRIQITKNTNSVLYNK